MNFQFDLTIIAKPHLIRSKLIKFDLANVLCMEHSPSELNLTHCNERFKAIWDACLMGINTLSFMHYFQVA